MNKTDILLPCPFCGNSVALQVIDQNEINYLSESDSRYSDNPYYTVVCSVNEHSSIPTNNWTSGCGASGGYYPTREQAITAWNRRYEPPNEPLTCKGCVGENLHYPDDYVCEDCRRGKSDFYYCKPERTEK